MNEVAEFELDAMKAEMIALRNALEDAREAAVAAQRRAESEYRAEIEQLQATAAALRDAMVHQREEFTASLQAVERDGAAEAEQLREAIVAARKGADEAREHQELVAAQQKQRFDTERRELEDTIAQLRRMLERTTVDGPA